MNWTVIHLQPGFDPEEAWEALEANGIAPLFSSETSSEEAEIVVILPLDLTQQELKKRFPFCRSAEPYAGTQETDWIAQWETHGHNFYGGFVHIDITELTGHDAIKPSWQTLQLAPGPGFGDLSHPTTQLTLQLMASQVQGLYILDIGSGSGILTLAAVALGAKHAYGVDIDEQAVIHARHNAEVNEMQEQTTFEIPEKLLLPASSTDWLIVINMIWSEQRIALPMWLEQAKKAKIIIVSGILCSEQEAYLQEVSQWGWKLQEVRYEGEWTALSFINLDFVHF